MHYKTNTFSSKDGETICYYRWTANKNVPFKGVVQISHGIGEYAGRYDSIAHKLQNVGYEVYANDHRAHGKTAEIKRLFGYYEGSDYFVDVVEDMHELAELMKVNHPGAKFVLFGHSMGSLLSRKYVTQYGDELDALILSGTASFIKGLGNIGLLSTKAVVAFRGRTRGNSVLKSFFFDEFNKKFKPNRTKLDWLSTDEAQVDLFEADPYRVENFSLGVFQDVIKNSKYLNQEDAFKATPKDLPVLIFSGDKDPVGEMGKGVKRVVNQYEKTGINDLTFHLYEGGRHEMLNETNSEEVETDILNWLKERIHD
ncbi:alpha/beta hydrolase [Ulvibacter antarcticus]|uniref:Alpha-beta hydrolase superfamily lysophospholipase n=1 Tax=Ulvibacter antarcticus TaxID=442714 RepID=A0A3L9YGM2_9FLAO|nr:alpha/beta hydrolase [Ulvibacter antarcticus]RMA58697.1 alpha-beta hydrolase superfamily lysophospholipase [Ulvibacter antarcticus]